jgi:Ni2+-binding GTPase involved in maturation of urease and hydrogenase
MRGERPFVFTNLKAGDGLTTIIELYRAPRHARGSTPA